MYGTKSKKIQAANTSKVFQEKFKKSLDYISSESPHAYHKHILQNNILKNKEINMGHAPMSYLVNNE